MLRRTYVNVRQYECVKLVTKEKFYDFRIRNMTRKYTGRDINITINTNSIKILKNHKNKPKMCKKNVKY